MMFVSVLSFAAGLGLLMNSIEFMVHKTRSPLFLNCIHVLAWTIFAWTQGLFLP